MKVLLINGSPHQQGCTFTALDEVAKQLHQQGVETELLWLGIQPVAGCIACGKCRETGRCVFADQLNDLLPRLGEFDGLVVGAPVYYAGPCGQICAFLDRLFYSGNKQLAGKPGAAVVSCRRGGASAAFDRLNKYFTINHMPLVSSQYWNQVHGNTPEEVRQDLEGLQTMRALADNLAWLLKAIAAGQAQGQTLPEREPRINTNFIR